MAAVVVRVIVMMVMMMRDRGGHVDRFESANDANWRLALDVDTLDHISARAWFVFCDLVRVLVKHLHFRSILLADTNHNRLLEDVLNMFVEFALLGRFLSFLIIVVTFRSILVALFAAVNVNMDVHIVFLVTLLAFDRFVVSWLLILSVVEWRILLVVSLRVRFRIISSNGVLLRNMLLVALLPSVVMMFAALQLFEQRSDSRLDVLIRSLF